MRARCRLGACLAVLLVVAAPALAQDTETRAPFITTPPAVVARMLRLAETAPRDFVIDLGSGDGRIVIEAARAHGASGLGDGLDKRDTSFQGSRGPRAD